MINTSSSAAATATTRPRSTDHLTSIAAAGPLLLAIGWILIGHLPHSPLWIAATRVLPAGLLLLALRPALPTGAWWHRSAILGVVNFAGFFSLQAVAVHSIPVGVAATIAATQTLLVPLGAVILINTPLRGTQILYAATGILGVALLVVPSHTHLDIAGIAAATGTALCNAFGLLLTRRWGQPHGVHHLTTTGWQLTAGGLLLLPVAMSTESVLPPTSGNTLAITAVVTTATAAAFAALFGTLHAGLPAATISRLMLLCPLAVTATGWLLYQQTLTPLQLLGALLIILPVAAHRPASVAPAPHNHPHLHRAPSPPSPPAKHVQARRRRRRRALTALQLLGAFLIVLLVAADRPSSTAVIPHHLTDRTNALDLTSRNESRSAQDDHQSPHDYPNQPTKGKAMPEHELPTWPDLVQRALDSLNQARSNMSAARDWLHSDWWPPGSALTDAAAEARTTVFTLIGTVKGQIDEAKGLLRDSEAERPENTLHQQ